MRSTYVYRDATGFLTYISMAMISPVKNKHSIGFIHSGNQNSESPGNDELDEDVNVDADDLQKTPTMKARTTTRDYYFRKSS